jgi:dipeptidyl aminopeptidase/acylaminoacyl peptidase
MSWREPAPEEHDAGERSWNVVREAFEARIPSPRPRDRRPLVLAAIGAAVLAGAFTPPGLAVWSSIRDAVQEERDPLVSLPAPGRLIVQAESGAWVVHRDGSKRFLPGYLNTAWSPHGKYVAATRGNVLVALEPNGRVHWKLARDAPIADPLWSYEGYRIAYLAGKALRIVNGDGTGDRLLDRNAVGTGLPAYAWRPGTHELAYKNALNQIVLVDVDQKRILWRRPARDVEQVSWSSDGRRLLVATGPVLVLDAAGRTVARLPRQGGVPAAFLPGGHDVSVVTVARGRSSVVLYRGPGYRAHRTVFSGPGLFAGLAWSPNARWLLVDWRSADEWIFIRRTAAPRVIPISGVGRIFDSGPEHYATLGGWCCP